MWAAVECPSSQQWHTTTQALKKLCNLSDTLPPSNMEPDRGVLEDHVPFKGTPCQVVEGATSA